MLILGLALLISGDDVLSWAEFSPKDGSFTARFPQTPQERASRTGTLWQHSAKDKVYNVARSPLPGGEGASPGEIEAALSKVRDNILVRVQAKLKSEKKLNHRGIPAREFLFELPEEKGLLRIRCFAVKDDVWEIKVGGPKDYVTGKQGDLFLEGLKVK